MAATETTNKLYQFGGFRLDVKNRLLLRDSQSISLTPKAFDLLLVFVENSGSLLEKEELVERIWGDSFVEEANLTRTVSFLRKALGDDPKQPVYIVTVTGHGYRFVADVHELPGDVAQSVAQKHSSSPAITVEEQSIGGTEKPVTPITSEAKTEGRRRIRKLTVFTAAACMMIALLSAVLSFWRSKEPDPVLPTVSLKTIAVLPCKPLAVDERDPTFEFGMAASLINRLSAIRGLVVRPASAIVKYTSVEQDPIAAGKEQGVIYVLASSYRKLGDRIVLTAQLIHVQNRSVLWSDVCEEQCDAFALHDALAEKTTRSLLLRLKDDEQRALTRHGTENKAAYALYTLGLYNWYQNKLDIERMQKSVHYFEQAIAKDPDYAMAYAWLATINSGLALGAGARRKDYERKAEELANRALELDDTVTQAHVTLGVSAYRYHWDWAKAERHFKRAWGLNPNDVEVSRAYSAYLSSMGHLDESIFWQRRACEIQPLSFDLSAMLAMRLYLARRYDEAIEQARTALQMGLTGEVPYVAWRSYEEKGMYEEAFTALKELCESEKAKDLSALVARTYSASGYKKAREVYLTNRLIAMKELAEKGIVAPIEVAVISALLNDRDEAFKWLEKAYEFHSDRLVYLKINPDFDSLRSDPRFADLVRRIGIP